MAGLPFEKRSRSEFHKEREIRPHQLYRRSQFEGTGRRLYTAKIELDRRGWNRKIVSKMI